jgi:hypothetical protein
MEIGIVVGDKTPTTANTTVNITINKRKLSRSLADVGLLSPTSILT